MTTNDAVAQGVQLVWEQLQMLFEVSRVGAAGAFDRVGAALCGLWPGET